MFLKNLLFQGNKNSRFCGKDRDKKQQSDYRWVSATLSYVPILCIGTKDSVALIHRYVVQIISV